MKNIIQPIVVTMGDPSGIGIEVTLRAWKNRKIKHPFFLIHDYSYVKKIIKKMKINIPLKLISEPNQAVKTYKNFLPIYQLEVAKNTQLGKPNKQNAKVILKSIDMALKFIQSGEVAAMVTNPIAKNIINYASKNFTGHTEYLAKKSKSKNFCMMLINDTIRVIPLTIHIPLKKVSPSISKKLIKDTLKIINQSIKKDFGNKKPKILITGLNPHAGENGFLGKEEKDIIKPAIDSLKKSINVYGPISADSAFTKENLNKYDAVLCMYHDQALIPVKTIDFYNTVNYTAGLNFVRTSPDHGTGFDIATKFIANENSLVSAIRNAIKISKNRSINK